MELMALMEKSEAGIYRLVNFLRQLPEKTSLKEIVTETGLSRSTLLKYIESFNELSSHEKLGLSLSFDGEDCWLICPYDFEWARLVKTLLIPAIKFQILQELYHHRSFSIQELSQKLLISEATLNRNLASLNDLLAEFTLSITAGRLRGPEHQIRYFYWQLFQQTLTAVEKSQFCSREKIQKEIEILQHFSKGNFNPNKTEDLALWLGISQQRWRNSTQDMAESFECMKPYADNVFYLRLEKVWMRSLSRYALEFDDIEVFCLFAFLVSMNILPPESMAFILGFGGPISDQLTSAIQVLRKEVDFGEVLPEEAVYLLGQVICRSYFFRGTILTMSKSNHRKQNLLQPFLGDLRSISTEQILLNVNKLGDLEEQLQEELRVLTAYLVQPEHESIEIGLQVRGTELHQQMVISILEWHFANNRLIRFSTDQLKKTYDVLITNVTSHQIKAEHVYRFVDDLSLQDIAQIEELINAQLEKRQKRVGFYNRYY